MFIIDYLQNYDHVQVIFISDDGLTMRYDDNGILNDIIHRAKDSMIAHNFSSVEIIDRMTQDAIACIIRK